MPASIQRVLERRGRVMLVETVNPATASGYSVRVEHLGIWRGDDREEAARQFDRAVMERAADV